QLNGHEPVYFLEKKTTINLGGVGVTLDPAQRGRQYLEKSDVVTLQAIKDQMGRRPLYFSRTVGPYADQFGLTGYLEGQGFVRKLHQDPIAESDSIKGIQGLGYVNVPRTEALAFQVYHGDTAARHRPRGWVDKPSEGILDVRHRVPGTGAAAAEAEPAGGRQGIGARRLDLQEHQLRVHSTAGALTRLNSHQGPSAARLGTVTSACLSPSLGG